MPRNLILWDTELGPECCKVKWVGFGRIPKSRTLRGWLGQRSARKGDGAMDKCTTVRQAAGLESETLLPGLCLEGERPPQEAVSKGLRDEEAVAVERRGSGAVRTIAGIIGAGA